MLKRREFLAAGAAAAAMSAASRSFAQVVAPNAAAGRPPPADIPYQGGTEVKKLSVINFAELEAEAKKVLPTGGFGYIQSGAGSEWTLRENTAAFERVQIEPQAVAGFKQVDMSVNILGSRLSMPVMMAPCGSHGLAHVSKEIGTAKAVESVGTLMITSTQANESMEAIAAANRGPKWFQLYFPDDRGFALELIQRAKAAGYTAIAPTVDNVVNYPRETNIRNNFQVPISLGKGNAPRGIADQVAAIAALRNRKVDLNWNDLAWIKEQTGLPVIVKGVLSVKTAQLAVQHGMDAVYVSNHGGRAFDGVPATFTLLPRIADVVQGRVPIILDGGVRRGADVFKALALGANAVAIGRPVLYGLALGGTLGAQSVLEWYRDNLATVMVLAGTPNIKSISRDFLAPARNGEI
jgi:isopentenyl diphosphate isomerase/L-lactate dehydrogenase-like FMN-dependent dehydrogenase